MLSVYSGQNTNKEGLHTDKFRHNDAYAVCNQGPTGVDKIMEKTQYTTQYIKPAFESSISASDIVSNVTLI